jgi:hypothetical protein
MSTRNLAERYRVTPLKPEFASVRTVAQLFGLSRTELFRLIAAKKLVSVHYKKNPTARKGRRLILLDSVRAYLQGLAD